MLMLDEDDNDDGGPRVAAYAVLAFAALVVFGLGFWVGRL